MATLDFSQSTSGVWMTHTDIVGFDSAGGITTDTRWTWATAAGHHVDLTGSGLAYDGDGRAVSGTVTGIAIDLFNDDTARPDIVITGIDAEAATLDDGRDSFWRILEGDDTITGGSTANAGPGAVFVLFGDGFAGAGGQTGGDDTFNTGDTQAYVFGDVVVVTTPAPGDPGTAYRGGDDLFFGPVSIRGGNATQQIFGDAGNVEGSGRLIGGADTILARSSSSEGFAAGDAGNVYEQAQVVGGADTVQAVNSSQATLIGDVYIAGAGTFVRGGGDTLTSGGSANLVIGDVAYAQGKTIGGADTIFGNGGADVISGDVYNGQGAEIVGGNDIIHGGEGADTIYGEVATGTPSALSRGNDQLFGDAGDDVLHGQSGDDILDGGSGSDRLDGGAGFDVASYASATAPVTVFLDSSLTPAAGDAIGDLFVSIEGLHGSTFDDVLGGNSRANRLEGDRGNDSLQGGAGNDALVGGAGRDLLVGGVGNDSFHFLALTDGRDRIADFSNAAGNNDSLRFLGDAFGDLAPGALAANRFVANASGEATGLAQRFVYETDTGILRFDANGSAAGGVTVIATLTDAPTLTLDDFAIL